MTSFVALMLVVLLKGLNVFKYITLNFLETYTCLH